MSTPDDDDLRVVERDGALLLRLHEREVQVLQWVFADLERAVLDAPVGAATGDDEVTKRLFPRAYLDPTEERAEVQWQSVAHNDLVELRLGALRTVGAGLDAAAPVTGKPGMREVVLDAARTDDWLTTLNDARLALGTALAVTADTDLDALEPDDPEFQPFVVYDWLTHLLGVLLEAAPEPEVREEDDPGAAGDVHPDDTP
jgi:hypothetical protein